MTLEFTATFGDIVPGSDYQFRVKAQNAQGLSKTWSPVTTITANARPDPMATPSTAIHDFVKVRIAWQIPASNFSPLLSYEVLIMTQAGTLLQSPDCLGEDPAQTYCDIPMINLRSGGFMLV